MTNNTVYSTMIRAGRTTYFIDVKETKDGKKYINITESKIDSTDKKVRSVVRIFSESMEPFLQALTEAITAAK